MYSMSFDVLGATGNRILTRESIDNMRTSRFDTPIKKADYRKARDFGYEYGLGVRTLVMPETSADSGDICSSPPGWRG